MQGEAGPDCVQKSQGWQPFILSIETQGPKQPPVVKGGSLYSSCRALNTADKAGVVDDIIAAGQQSLAGTGIYRVEAKPRPLYMMWSPPGVDSLGYFTEYIPGNFIRVPGSLGNLGIVLLSATDSKCPPVCWICSRQMAHPFELVAMS
jgi:hypothetical protein